MILSALADYYDQLLVDGKVAAPGWCAKSVSFILELSQEGELRGIIPLEKGAEARRIVPEQVKRSVNVAANFLCDTSSYLLGVDAKGNEKRARTCFEAARELHHRVLDGVEGDCAQAVLRFFDRWEPGHASSHEALTAAGDEPLKGGAMMFSVLAPGGPAYPTEDPAIRVAWEAARGGAGDEPVMTCLVTGERGEIARLHPSIKGVFGAQSSGSTLVGFNAPAFESYGHAGEQGRNAPVGKHVVQAYSAALNWLLADPGHHMRLGDTTVVYWSERNDEKNAPVFSWLVGAQPLATEDDAHDADKLLDGIMRGIASGRHIDESVDVASTFYVLGLAPNAARLSVRFFMRDEFGALLRNLCRHYELLEIAHAPHERRYLSPYRLLRAVENENASKPVVSSVLSAALMKAILEGGRYPEALYQHALLRIRATHEVGYERAAIIKAYLLRNGGKSKEEITVTLNQERNETAYALGRAFTLLEWIQEEANGKATIASRYLDSASSTPAAVFPVLLRLSEAHLAKIGHEKPGLARSFSRQLQEILGGECVQAFPRHLPLLAQGDFFLGRYHQLRKRYEKKASAGEGAKATAESVETEE